MQLACPVHSPTTPLAGRPRRAGRSIFVLLVASLVSASPGCVFNKVRKDKKIVKQYGEVLGSVQATNWAGLSIIIAAGRLPGADDNLMVVSHVRALAEPQDFDMKLVPGRYVIGAFEDANTNMRHDEGERGVLSEAFEVRAGETVKGIVLLISEVFERDKVAKYELLREQPFSRGDVAPLSDPRFAREPARKGLWEPAKYALENRPGVYFLEPYDLERTPVLFVHGMSGYPQEFETLIGRLDSRRFQPWVFMYPSGYALTDVAEFLHDTIVQLEATHSLERMCVVAHSMGGLVSRRFLGLHLADTGDQAVRAFVTMASPLDGLPSAALGMKMAPAVVPAWYDIAPGSEFLNSLYQEPLSSEVEYHLLFTYDKSGASDGVVPILSQLRDEAQAEAEVVRGFRASHIGVLESGAAAAQVLTALDRCRGDTEAPRVAPRPLEPSR